MQPPGNLNRMAKKSSSFCMMMPPDFRTVWSMRFAESGKVIWSFCWG
jgi:hypothetical protein